MRRLLWSLLFAALLALLFATSALPNRLDVTVGEPAPHNIKAPREFEDRPATERLRAEAEAEVPGVYEQDPAVGEDVLARLEEVYATIRRIRSDLREVEEVPIDGENMNGNLATELQRAARDLEDVAPVSVDPANVRIILDVDRADIDEAEAQSESLLSFFFSQGVKSDGLDAFREQIRESFERAELPNEFATFAGKMTADLLVPNLVYNAEETENRRRVAAEGVEPEMILNGQVLVSDGEVISSEDMVRLRDAGLLVDDTPWRIYLSSIAYAFILIALAGLYFNRLDPDIIESESSLVLIGLVFLVTLFISRLTMTVSPFLAPLAAGTILLAVLLRSQAAIFMGVLMSLGLFLVSGGDIRVVLVGFVGAIGAALVASRVEGRNDLMRAGITASVAGIITLVAYTFYTGGVSVRDTSLWRDLLWAGGNGVLSAVVAIGTLPFLEALFGMITPVKLVELASPTQPPLRHLLQEAPGTHQPSLTVANMAAAAPAALAAVRP